ncbi:tRNA 2-selenouridine(34) synthase MnmH [Cohnella sp. CIP 111063]|uniref:tRNA 2-selenouridine(34) synthase MnmH n=1 Tax=unclassified Cohnella TaxID=2636738 RepID=UPI000B8C35AC|nr:MULTISPECIES: tRNA 2-selenouridine(34) synthase MnmH [unclassified Cohnella]OXS57302.1 tRNA 2-selenouridine(34) synthase MnmH [Cohnella sp. CIP 111063]PRX70742.1 tRNA 2-selenouridine synthase [Cohnella sp. SGD-V74]
MLQDITLEELRALQQKQQLAFIDVRSPSEYELATIPGSLNIPLFNDAERAEIGTIYKQTSVQAAKERGLEIVSAKLPAFIKEFAGIGPKKVVFCWRGGMRSKTTATLLSLMGIQAFRLIGGYREYRRWVVETINTMDFPPRAYVIHGNTGTGKTALLRRLQEEDYPVLDLEAMAGHRGSIFGHIGLKSHNQKTFDAHLLEEMLRYRQSPYVLFEAESKRIGKIMLPDSLIRKKEEGVPIWIDMPVHARVEQILQDYRPAEYKEQYVQAFRQIKSRIHTPVAAEIEALLLADRFAEAVELLLLHYYDPRYAYTAEQYGDDAGIRFSVRNADEALQAIRSYISDV